jgi:LEA14-like dessication related protein
VNRRFLVLGGVATLFATGACALFMKSPSVSIAGVRVSSIGLEGATAQIALDVSNPNGFTLTSAGLDYSLAFEEADPRRSDGAGWRVIAEGASDDPASVPGKETLQMTLSVPFRYEDVGRAVQQFRRAGELRYRLTGRVRFDAPLRDVLVPFVQTGTMGL